MAPGSIAARAGFKAGDTIERINQQRIVSVADIQWELEKRTGESQTRYWEVQRNGRLQSLAVRFTAGWRRANPFIWRVTSWDLRRMGFGGMKLEDMTDAERKARGLSLSQMALEAKNVGQYGEHAVAKKAGVRKGDIIVGFDGVTKRATEQQALAHAMRNRMKGDTLSVAVLRGSRKLNFRIRMQ